MPSEFRYHISLKTAKRQSTRTATPKAMAKVMPNPCPPLRLSRFMAGQRTKTRPATIAVATAWQLRDSFGPRRGKARYAAFLTGHFGPGVQHLPHLHLAPQHFSAQHALWQQ